MIPQLFIFDMDGLLLDSEQAYMHVMTEVMAENGYTLTREMYIPTLGLSTADDRLVMQGYFGENFPFDVIMKESRRRMNARAAVNPPAVKAGIRELLEELQRRQIPACVASSSPRKTIDIYLTSSGLLPFFSFVISGDDITHSKPDPEIFLLCCRHFGIQPGDAVVLEDSENGIRAALNGKIPVIGIPDMKQPAAQLAEAAWMMAEDAHEVRERIFCE